MNTEPDEYQCACPDGYSGRNCQIGKSRLRWRPANGLTSRSHARFCPSSRTRLRVQPLRQRGDVSRGAVRLRLPLSAGLGRAHLRPR